jgi:hypothetical protein
MTMRRETTEDYVRNIFYKKLKQLENKRITTVEYLARLQALEEAYYALGIAPTARQIGDFERREY